MTYTRLSFAGNMYIGIHRRVKYHNNDIQYAGQFKLNRINEVEYILTHASSILACVDFQTMRTAGHHGCKVQIEYAVATERRDRGDSVSVAY